MSNNARFYCDALVICSFLLCLYSFVNLGNCSERVPLYVEQHVRIEHSRDFFRNFISKPHSGNTRTMSRMGTHRIAETIDNHSPVELLILLLVQIQGVPSLQPLIRLSVLVNVGGG